MDDEPKPKRHKISRGDDDYVPGNITEIELCNFMTFDKLTCKPGSRLNLVIGPNGSGKSSLVCAIALGLGGEPQLLGRATSIGAYVKRGEESGYIKISLRGERKEDPITITRKIDIRNKSEWLFNGKTVAKKEIIEIIQRFNVQVNNLTQFLPQDRVCEFAKLTPVQLLEETEKAVGDLQLPIQHQALITKSRELKKLERAIESNKGSLDHLMAHNAELEKDVERLRQRDDLLAKVDSMKKKLPWLKYDIKKAEYLEAEQQEKDAKLRVVEAASALKVLTEPIEEKKREKDKQESKCKKIDGLLGCNMKKRLQIFESDSRWGAKIKGKYKEIEDFKNKEESHQQKILKAKDDLGAAQAELASLPPYEPPKNKMEELSSQILELEEIAKEIISEKRKKEKDLNNHKLMLMECVDKLKHMGSVRNKRLQALENSGAEYIFKAHQWVQDNDNIFNKAVYGPVLVEVNVSDKFHADCLEGHVARYIWKSFITQDSGDRDLLIKSLANLGLRFPVINHEERDCRPRAALQITDEMHKLGVSSRLDQVFDAPYAVKEVLISQFGLDNSYIGSRQTDAKADYVHRLGISDVWTPENHYVWRESRYGAHESTIVDSVGHSNLLRCSSDGSEIDRLKLKKQSHEETISRIEADVKALQTTLTQKENEAAGLRREREEIVNIVQSEKKKLKELEFRVNQRRTKLKSLERSNDPDTTIVNLLDQVKELKIQRFQYGIEAQSLLIEAVANRRNLAENYMQSLELQAKIKEMESSAEQQKQTVLQASTNHEHCEKALHICLQQLSAAKRHAESVAVLTPELQQAFLEMPSTVEDLEAAIQDIRSQVDSILCLNPNVLQEYESRRRKIEELMEKQEMDETEFNSRSNEINALKELWLPTLQTLVHQINETFSRNFQEMAVAGEVSLDEQGMDFDQYGILIKVKFRQTGQLQVLSAHHQSGGERSVSTILYLVSLQDLTNCPFRVVDEINQGMDPINERKMFQQLVRAASQPNTPQCFLLTPKLLPNLEYSDACSILTVMNGPWIEQASHVWSGGDSWGSLSVPAEENCC